MLTQQDADAQHARLHAAMTASPDFSKPSALVSLLMDAFENHAGTAAPGILANTMYEVTVEYEKGNPILRPSTWTAIISETYKRMFYTVADLKENGFEILLNAGALADFTDWNIGSINGTEVSAKTIASFSGMH